MKDLKYLGAYFIPAVCITGLIKGGILAFATPFFAFVFIPILEQLFPKDRKNVSKSEVEARSKNILFDLLLYINIIIVYGTLILFMFQILNNKYSAIELTGLFFSVGIVLGANGINVAHELGHRFNKFENILAQLLLLPSFYMHFFIEHNYGHHKNVATPTDPATSRKNEIIYIFYFRTVIMSYLSAWKIQLFLLKQKNQSFLSPVNKMLIFQIITLGYITSIIYLMGTQSIWIFMSGILGFLLLETINYIEHYGLIREKKKNGNYERVLPVHSWNSDFMFGRIMLYELTRHSDHHHISSKKYQILETMEEAPELPMGYPAAMMLSLFPPLWFKVMNKRIPNSN